jgi:hypothetical protein
MKKKWMAMLAALMASVAVSGCETLNNLDSDATDGEATVDASGGSTDTDAVTSDDTGASTTDTGPVGPTDPCPGTADWSCDLMCAEAGTLDNDCNTSTSKCDDPKAQATLKSWMAGKYKSVMSEKTPNCDWTPGKCDAQFRCSNKRCFCDPDCYDDATLAPKPACSSDGHCDTWCPKGEDPDCKGKADDGKYCG